MTKKFEVADMEGCEFDTDTKSEFIRTPYRALNADRLNALQRALAEHGSGEASDGWTISSGRVSVQLMTSINEEGLIEALHALRVHKYRKPKLTDAEIQVINGRKLDSISGLMHLGLPAHELEYKIKKILKGESQ